MNSDLISLLREDEIVNHDPQGEARQDASPGDPRDTSSTRRRTVLAAGAGEDCTAWPRRKTPPKETPEGYKKHHVFK